MPTSTSEPVLTCHGLAKSFGDLVAVKDVGFQVAAGETYGLLGPNGAGKTTTISIIAGILRADAGEVTIAGEAITTSATRARRLIGYVPQELAVYPDLTGWENLRFFAGLYGLRRKQAVPRIRHVLEVVGLTERSRDQVKQYSGGMKRRLNIAIGLLHEPRLLVLDEPTAGVDPQSRHAILDNVAELAGAGLAIVYTTHYMEEAERLCDRVGIIDNGQMVAEGTRSELVARLGEQTRITLTVDGDLAAAARAAEQDPRVIRTAVHEDKIDLLTGEARECLPGVLGLITGTGAVVRAAEVTEPDLELLFLHLTGKALRG